MANIYTPPMPTPDVETSDDHFWSGWRKGTTGVRSQMMKDHQEGEKRLGQYEEQRKMGIIPKSPLKPFSTERELQDKADIIGRLKKKGLVHEV